jgi:DNA-binding CsgD family transcriptional regulator
LDGFDERLQSLIGEIYDAAVEADKWASLAPRIAAAFDAESCAVQTRTPAGVQLLTVTGNFTPTAARDYEQHYHRLDEWANGVLSRPSDVPTLGEEVISTDALMKSPFAEYLRRTERRHLVGGVVSVGATEQGLIGVHRVTRGFDAASKQRMGFLFPHLRRALQVRSMVNVQGRQRDAALQALGSLATAAFLVDADGLVLFANEAATALLREGDGLSARNGRLAARTEAATATLLGLVASCARTAAGHGGHPGAAMSLPRRTRRPLTALVSPMRPAALAGAVGDPGGLAIVFVRDPVQAGAAGLAALRALFRLTPAEARLASALADGASIERYAEAQGLSHYTVRALLKRVMRKTTTNRQGELIALILRSSATLQPPGAGDGAS